MLLGAKRTIIMQIILPGTKIMQFIICVGFVKNLQNWYLGCYNYIRIGKEVVIKK